MTIRILCLNGPNLNLLGEREPGVYGPTTLQEIARRLEELARTLDVEVDVVQTNHEGELIDRLQEARKSYDGVILNPGGYSHTSVALLDTLLALPLPVIEVHLSQVFRREPFRQQLLTARGVHGVIVGLGPVGYELALLALVDLLGGHEGSAEPAG
ncbi:MAG: type II 3-dehydroquinate dehydratase [Candidatus Hydrothermae bacterium]|nr:type II 3-dehydroquinate dehydratase [Candidatus Hydrothermae bacterium]